MPGTSPGISRLTIRNQGERAVDVSQWHLHVRGRDGLEFDDGTVIPAEENLAVIQVNATERVCPESTKTAVIVCFEPARGPPPLFVSGSIVLEDSQGEMVLEWNPPQGGPSTGLP